MLEFIKDLQQLENLINEDKLGSIDVNKLFVIGGISLQVYQIINN